MLKSKERNGVDLWVYVAVLLLVTIGVVEVYSSSVFLADQKYGGEQAYFFQKQLIFAVMAILAMLVMSAIDYHWLAKFIWPAIGFSLILLVIVLFQRKVNDSSRWIFLGPVSIQPSEMFKYSVVTLLACHLGRRYTNSRSRLQEYMVFGSIAAGIGLIFLEPDLGIVIVLSAVAVAMMYIAGLKLRWIAAGGATLAGAGTLMVFVIGYKKDRILEYLAALQDPLSGSYQVKQSILYIGSGGLFGKGIGRGAAKLFYLPAPHTDFIFANFAEEGGFFWVAVVVALFVIIFWRGMRIAAAAQDRFGFFLAYGITMMLVVSALINIGVTVNLIPATGIPLPFVSYGGSSLVVSGIAAGLLLNISRKRTRMVPLFVSD